MYGHNGPTPCPSNTKYYVFVFINQFQSPPDCNNDSALRSCPVPAAPENGAVEVTGVQPIVASYTCHEGATLVGSEIRTCQQDGSWSGEEPSCRTGMMQI